MKIITKKTKAGCETGLCCFNKLNAIEVLIYPCTQSSDKSFQWSDVLVWKNLFYSSSQPLSYPSLLATNNYKIEYLSVSVNCSLTDACSDEQKSRLNTAPKFPYKLK